MRFFFLRCLVWLALPAMAAERNFNFSQLRESEPPAGFRSAVTGLGKPGDWKIILDEVPPAIAPLAPEARKVSKRAVLAQLSQDPTDEHFSLFIFDEESFGDFTLATRIKTVRGAQEQMAGLAFRIQNETNYYVVRASSLGSTFRFYKVLDGERGPPVGPELSIPVGTWHDLVVECKGNQIRCLLDGQELISVTDKVNPFTTGKVAFWTKSDSVSYFGDTKVTYAHHEPPAQSVVRDMLKKHPHLIDLKIYVADPDPKAPRLVGSKDARDLGQKGGTEEHGVITLGSIYYGKDKGTYAITMPLRDHNGDTIAAARVVLKSFTGQTEQNALARAVPIVKEMQNQVQSLHDLID